MRIYLRFFEDDMVKYGTLCFFPLEVHFPEITPKKCTKPWVPDLVLEWFVKWKMNIFLMGKYNEI